METQNKLIVKKGKNLISYITSSRNPQMLLRFARHFILTICASEYFLKPLRCFDKNLLFPDFRVKIETLIEFYTTKHSEHEVNIYETYRSIERQNLLYLQGATKIRSLSMHHYGLAVDLTRWFNNRNIWTLDYDLLRIAGNELGLTNLYPFESCHFQFIPCSMQNDFREYTTNVIKIVQDLLNCNIDGDCGPITQGAILFNVERLTEYFDDTLKQLDKIQADERSN